jgi:hypothetical protein
MGNHPTGNRADRCAATPLLSFKDAAPPRRRIDLRRLRLWEQAAGARRHGRGRHRGVVTYEWNVTMRITKGGPVQAGCYPGAEHGPFVQAGHLSAHASRAPQRFVLEDADANTLSGAMIESCGAYSFKQAVEIEGVPVEYGTALLWERLGLLRIRGGAGSLPRVEPPAAR